MRARHRLGSPAAAAAGLLAVAALARLVYIQAEVVDLYPDEAHYWEWSRRLDLGYYSKGPLVAWIIAAGTAALGDTPAGVRIGAVAAGVLLGAALFVLVRDLAPGDRWAPFLTVALVQALPYFAAMAVVQTIDPPLLVLWTVAMLALWRGLGGSRAAWLLAGAAVGVGLLAKYTMVLVLPSLALYLLLAPERRGWLRRPEPWLAAAVALAAFSPVLVWNARHDWVSFRHTAARAEVARGLQPAFALEFLGGQVLLVLTPLVAAGVAWALWRGWREGLVGRREPARFLACFALPTLAFYAGLSLFSKVQTNWAAPGYLPALALAVLALRERAARLRPAARARLRVLVGAGVALALAVTVVAHDVSLLRRLGLPVGAGLDPSARLVGWRELAGRVEQAGREMGGPGRVFVLSDRYQVTSALAFHLGREWTAHNLNRGRRLNQYDLWGGLERMLGRDAVYVTPGAAAEAAALVPLCREVGPAERLEVRRAGQLLRVFSLFRCRGFHRLPPPPPRITY